MQAATGITERKVRDILAILQNDGSICVEQVTKNHARLITVCKYREYQNSQIQPVNYITQVANFYCTPETARVGLQNVQQNSAASRYISDGYEIGMKKVNQQLTNNQPTINQQLTNNQPTGNQQVTTYKNIRNKEIKNTSSSSARMREEIFSGYSVEEEEESEKKAMKESFAELALNDARWLAAMSKRSRLPETELSLINFDLTNKRKSN